MEQNEEKERLQQAAEKYAQKEYPDEPSVGLFGTGDYEPARNLSYKREEAIDDFIAGAQWQKEQYIDDIKSAEDHAYFAGSEYDRKDAIKNATTEELKAELKRRGQLPLLPSNLEDAAISICADILEGETIIVDGYECVVLSDAEECFKSGAMWIASQGITVEGDNSGNGLSNESLLKLEEYLNSLPKESKVILQVRNKTL